MPDILIEVEVYCAACGAGLCNQCSVKNDRMNWSRGLPGIHVDPCERCLEKARQEGREKVVDERAEP